RCRTVTGVQTCALPICRFALLTFVSFAFAGVVVAKDAGNATDAINPHSPRYGHPYRHGVHPTRETHEKMKAWEAANRGVVRPARSEERRVGKEGRGGRA